MYKFFGELKEGTEFNYSIFGEGLVYFYKVGKNLAKHKITGQTRRFTYNDLVWEINNNDR